MHKQRKVAHQIVLKYPKPDFAIWQHFFWRCIRNVQMSKSSLCGPERRPQQNVLTQRENVLSSISPLSCTRGGVRGQARRGSWESPREGPDRANPGGVRGGTGGWPGKAQRNQWGGVEIVPPLLIRPVSAAFPASESVFDAGGEETGRWFSPGPLVSADASEMSKCPTGIVLPGNSSDITNAKKKGPNCKSWGQ